MDKINHLNVKRIINKHAFLIAVCLFSGIYQAKAQVTIGSGSPPAEGVLLQLKENDNTGANATKGMMLPRMYLSDKNNLYPMFEDQNNSGLPSPDYASIQDKQKQDELHIGLYVYNLNPCNPFGRGTYVWNGQEWIPLGKTFIEGYSTLMALPDTLHIPSGMDSRSWTAQTMSFEYLSQTSPTWGNLVSSPSYNGLEFADQSTQILPNNPASWSGRPAVFSIQPNKMTSSQVTKLKPWHTRQSSVTLSFDQAPCGGIITKNVLLNQTNYAISGRIPTSNNNTTDEEDILNMITIRNTNLNGTVKVLSNVRWQAFVQPLGGNVSEVLSNYTQTPQGINLSDGNFGPETFFTYNGASGAPGSRFKYVKVNLRDVDNRASDFEITIMQCEGNEDLTSVTENATPAQTSGSSSDWGDKVVRHLEKPGIYEEFYSADFGSAGRWMVTNLAAVDYDSDVTPNGFSNMTESLASTLTAGHYAYPGNSLQAYLDNTYLGLLYNFAGATAGQKTGLNVDEPNNPSQAKVQGVCPNGWHLPSDYEWTQLENEIITNTTKYAHVSKNIIDNGGSLVPPSASGGNYRGKHAPAMTNACEIYQGNVKGTSKSIAEGGFGAYFAGEIVNAAPNDFGETAAYWSSSLYNMDQAYYRVMSTGIGDAGVAAFANSQTNYMSVRCKKG